MKCNFGEESFIDKINQIEDLDFRILVNNAGVPPYFSDFERLYNNPESGFYENFTQREIILTF